MWPSDSRSFIFLLLISSILAMEPNRLPPKIPIPVEAGLYNNATSSTEGVDKSLLLGLFDKRQNVCASGCTYCCSDGVCAGSAQDACCGGYYCDAPKLCGWYRGCCAAGTKPCHDGCIPNNAQCCEMDRYCDEGTYCYRVNGMPACCNEAGEDCEYYSWPESDDVTESSTLTYDSTTSTGTQWEYYTQTITWTYWVTYYTYHISISTSFLTSTATTTTTIVSVSATDTAAASSSFDELSATLTFTPPASATNPPTPDSTSTSTSISEEPGSGIDNDSPSLRDDTAGEQNENRSRPQFSAPWGHLLILYMSIMPGLAAVLL